MPQNAENRQAQRVYRIPQWAVDLRRGYLRCPICGGALWFSKHLLDGRRNNTRAPLLSCSGRGNMIHWRGGPGEAVNVRELRNQVAEFNRRFPVGSAVLVRTDDAGFVQDVIALPAEIIQGCRAVTHLVETPGAVLLSRVEPPPAAAPGADSISDTGGAK